MAKGIRIGLDEVACKFSELEDPRSEINRLHPLVSVLVIAIMASLAGASGPTEIALWALQKADLLTKLLSLPNGVPSKDVFRRVLAVVRPAAFQACFANWLKSGREGAAQKPDIDQLVCAIDGKASHWTQDERTGLSSLDSVRVWASDFGLGLGQVATNEKSNEIMAIPELMKLIDIQGAIITIDAIGTQAAIAAQIIDEGGDYVLALKDNQEKLHEAIIEFVDKRMDTNFSDCGARRHMTERAGHERKETQHYVQLPVPQTLAGFRRWKGLLTIGVTIPHCLRDGEQTADIGYYISSLPMGVKTFAHAARAHGAIQEPCHWRLDITYREDESRIRNEHLRESLAWLNKFTLSLLKQHPAKDSLAMKRRSCGWSDEFLIETITGTTTS